jgi:small GTP-binding protein
MTYRDFMKEFIKKVCMCGDSAVGKTSLIRRFVTGKYKEKYITTLGTVISKKIVKFPRKDLVVNMQIWDISGQAEFKRIQASAFRKADGALAVCDLLRPQTALSLFEWIRNLRKYAESEVPVIVLVNKYDAIDRKGKNMDEINKILDYIDCPVLTTSAKSGMNVERGFEALAEGIMTDSLRLPKSASDLVAMPEIFENPYALLDYMIMRYSKTFGDDEMSIHLIRSQAEVQGTNFNRQPKEETIKMINRMLQIINNFKGEKEAKQLRTEFMEAYKRCSW